MKEKNPIAFSTIWTNVKDYLSIHIQLFKLIAIEKTAKLIADVIANMIVLSCIVAAFLASTLTLTFYFANLLNSYVKGFSCITAFFILLTLLVLWKKVAIQKYIRGKTIKRYFEKHCESQQDENC